MRSAVIFYNQDAWLSDQPECFGVRFDAQLLPRGSVVVGFMKTVSGEVQELLDKPATEPTQEDSWNDAVTYARAVLNEDHSTRISLEEKVL